jgi:hypothetical protein
VGNVSKLIFIHYLKADKDFMRETPENRLAEWNRYLNLAEENGLKLLASGDPWGNEWTSVTVFEAENGFDDWYKFSRAFLRVSKPDAWKYVEASKTDVLTPLVA